MKRGYQFVAGNFEPDDGGAPISDAVLRAKASTAGQEITYTCAPPGSGYRMGINRDEDIVLDGIDNCPAVVNDDQTDTDSDGLGDPCDPTPLPEPNQVLMLLTALPLLAWMGRRRGCFEKPSRGRDDLE